MKILELYLRTDGNEGCDLATEDNAIIQLANWSLELAAVTFIFMVQKTS